MTGPAPLPKLLLVTGGLLIWSLCLGVLYAALSLGCEAGVDAQVWWEAPGLSVLLTALWVVHLALLAGAFVTLYRARRRAASEPSRFLARLTCLLLVTGAVGTIWIGFPVLLLPPCA